VPAIYDGAVPDETLFVSTDDGWDMTERLWTEEGLHVGHSAGANVYAAWTLGRRLAAGGRQGCVATILCDRGDRYFTPMKWERVYVW
jgi:cysteine synthase B